MYAIPVLFIFQFLSGALCAAEGVMFTDYFGEKAVRRDVHPLSRVKALGERAYQRQVFQAQTKASERN